MKMFRVKKRCFFISLLEQMHGRGVSESMQGDAMPEGGDFGGSALHDLGQLPSRPRAG